MASSSASQRQSFFANNITKASLYLYSLSETFFIKQFCDVTANNIFSSICGILHKVTEN